MIDLQIPLLQTPIHLLAPNLLTSIPSKLLLHIINIIPSISVILIGQFTQILHLPTGHLEYRVVHGIIHGIREPLPFAVFQLLLLDQQEEIDPGGPQMAVVVPLEPVAVVVLDL